jgi:hypothetical protein
MTMPFSVMRIRSSVSRTHLRAMTPPLRLPALMLMIPFPPRDCRRYASNEVRFPNPFSQTVRMVAWGVDEDHADDAIPLGEADAGDAVGGAPHRPELGLGEADGKPLLGAEDDLVLAAGDRDADERIALLEGDGDDAAALGVAEGGELGLLDDPALGGEDEVPLVERPDREDRGDRVLGGDLEGDEGLAARGARQFGEVVDLEPVDLPLPREEEEGVVGGGDEEVLDEVPLLRVRPDDALPAAFLLPVAPEGHALDVAGVGEDDDLLLLGDEVLDVELLGLGDDDLGAPRVAVLLLHLEAVLADDVEQDGLVAEDGLVAGDLLAEALEVVADLVLLEAGQALQSHLEDGLGLDGGEGEPLDKGGMGGGRVRRRLDDLDHLVDVGQRD